MSDHSHIQWTDATWPVTTGCTKVSEGCRNCYAIRDAWRLSHNPNMKVSEVYNCTVEKQAGKLDWTGLVKTHPERLDWPLKWRKPRKIFVCNESDLFHEDVPDEFLAQVWAVMSRSTKHTFQVLTKRPERMQRWIARCVNAESMGWITHDGTPPAKAYPGTGIVVGQAGRWPLPNVWLGVSIEDQRTADERIPILLQTPAAVRFVSAEPLLGPVDLTKVNYSAYLREFMRQAAGEAGAASVRQEATLDALNGTWDDGWDTGSNGKRLDWVICGGESGPGARPCDLSWIRSIVQQCRAAGVKCFVKQLGGQPYFYQQHGDAPVEHVEWVQLTHKKGGDPAEWPADLRVREMPCSTVDAT